MHISWGSHTHEYWLLYPSWQTETGCCQVCQLHSIFFSENQEKILRGQEANRHFFYPSFHVSQSMSAFGWVVFPLLTVFHMCPYVSALRYDSKVNCDVYSSRFLLNTIICARQLSLNMLYAVAYTRSLNCFCIILYFPPIFLQSDNILCQRYTVFLVPLLLVDT